MLNDMEAAPELCGYTSDCAIYEKEKNYHESTKGKSLDGDQLDSIGISIFGHG